MVTTHPIGELRNGIKFISNDGFRDFRSWIVGLGKKAFEEFKNFEEEEGLIKYNLDCELAYREDLEYLIIDLYELAQITEERNVEKIFEKKYKVGCDGDYEKDLLNPIEWKKLDKKYPRLIQKYTMKKY